MKARSDNPQRCPFDLFTPGWVRIVVEAPEQCRTGCHFDDAVQSEADQRHGPGDCPGDDGDETFDTVVADSEVFEPLAPANKVVPDWAENRHTAIISPPDEGRDIRSRTSN
jgi:hypothetical protein